MELPEAHARLQAMYSDAAVQNHALADLVTTQQQQIEQLVQENGELRKQLADKPKGKKSG